MSQFPALVAQHDWDRVFATYMSPGLTLLTDTWWWDVAQFLAVQKYPPCPMSWKQKVLNDSSRVGMTKIEPLSVCTMCALYICLTFSHADFCWYTI
jgi:hypothetical protein